MSDVQTGPLCPIDRRLGWVEVKGVRHWVQRAELRRVRDAKRQAWLLQRFRTRTARAERRKTWLLQRANRRRAVGEALRRTVVHCFEQELEGKPSPSATHVGAIAERMALMMAEGEILAGLSWMFEYQTACG